MSYGAGAFGTVPLGAPLRVVAGEITFFRAAADLLTTGWTSTEASLSAAINETSPNDSSYITSPDVGGTPGPARMSLSSAMPAGSYTARFRARRTDTAGEARLVLLDASDASVGATAWQALTGSLALYELPVTTSAEAVRFQVEVRD